MKVVSTIADLRSARASSSVGFVPTMGALHEGHRSLMRRSVAEQTQTVVSIFVNPTQFAPGEDFDRYPRTLEADLEACRAEGVGIVFAPTLAEMYPTEPVTKVHLPALADKLEGEVRPGHFDGVGLVVTKLLNAVGECTAYFGKKDRQQLAIVTRMVTDLNIPATIVGCETVREPDGLALSSRNVYLSTDERQRALSLSAALRAISESDEPDAAELKRLGMGYLTDVDVDYLVIADPETLDPVTTVDRPAVALVAAKVGNTRLIDNLDIDPK